MKEAMRLFVAAALPPALTTYLIQQAALYQHEAIRQVPPPNLHLTLFFLGSTPGEALPGIEEKLLQTAQRHSPFELRLQCLEPGPRPKSPRLIWARFEQSPPFMLLMQDLAKQLSPLPPKLQKPIPHVTIARFRKGKPVPRALPVIRPAQPLVLPVKAIALWQSELASPHPVYRELLSFPLGQNL